MKHAISEDTVNKFSDYIKSIIKVADNIRKGAASNAIQIVEKMIEK